jgi:pilus assembly protein Flp/PilA
MDVTLGLPVEICNPGERRTTMRSNFAWLSVKRFVDDTRGQDLIEYALMAGFVAVAAGAIMPSVATQITTIFSKVTSLLTAAAA